MLLWKGYDRMDVQGSSFHDVCAETFYGEEGTVHTRTFARCKLEGRMLYQDHSSAKKLSGPYRFRSASQEVVNINEGKYQPCQVK